MPASPYDFADRTAVITGGGTGIGKATALHLGSMGANVVLASRTKEALQDAADLVQAATGRKALVVPTDVRAPEDIDQLVDATVAEFGRIDIVVNNAGGTYLKALGDLTLEDWDRIVSLNLSSVFSMIRATIPYLSVAGGSIVNVSSSSASYGTVGGAAYSAAKSGVEMLTKVAAAELTPQGIRVNCVAPGLVRSEGAERSWQRGGLDIAGTEARLPMRRVGEPEDIARIIAFLASDAAAYLTGEIIHADGGPQMDGLEID